MRRFGLIGRTLSHSFSKRYFTEKFHSQGITDCVYENYPLAAIEELEKVLRDPELEGLNVTVPYKEAVLPYVDSLSDAAAAVGAVNCIVFRHGRKIGYNTDVMGFAHSLRPLLDPFPQRALILGTGGAAKAVAYVLAELDIVSAFVSRRPVAGGFTYGELTADILARHTLIVNASPVGTTPDIDKAPAIPYALLNDTHLLYDLVYNPAETRFLALGKRQGARIKNGYEMLVGQAEASWNLWNEVA